MLYTGAASMFFAATAAEAGVFGKVAGALSEEVVALIVSAVVAMFAGALGIIFVRVTRTFREAGEFLNTLGYALEDHRITREELATIIREGKEVFMAWK